MSQAAQWTWLVYVAEDNNLEEDYSPDYSDLTSSKDGKWRTFLKALFTV